MPAGTCAATEDEAAELQGLTDAEERDLARAPEAKTLPLQGHRLDPWSGD